MDRARWATALFCVVLLANIVRAVRREHIRVEYSMAWFAAALGLLALCLSDWALERLSALLGVQDFAFVLLLVGAVAFLFTFFRFSVEVSALKDHNIVLTQKIGMLEWEVRRQARRLRELGGKSESQPQGPEPGA